MGDRSFGKRGTVSFIVLFLSLVLGFYCISASYVRDVRADSGIWTGSGWSQGDGQYCVNFGFFGYNDGDVIVFHLNLNAYYFSVVNAGGVYNYSTDEANGVFSGTVTYNSSSPNYTITISGDFDEVPTILSGSVDGVSYAAPTTTTTAAPTPTPRPATPTPAPAAPAATTAAPAATTATPETAAPASGAEGNTSSEDETAATAATESDTSESTEESDDTDESTDETSEETKVTGDNPTLVADEAARHDEPVTSETTSGEAVEQPDAPVVVAKTKTPGKNYAPAVMIVLALLAGAGVRYAQLKKRDLEGSEIALNFIPGVANIVGKSRPSKEVNTAPATAVEEKPKVVNGYLQTSNTRSIRPEFSNAAALAKLEEKKAANNTLPGVKPPVKRPSSASVNHAEAAKQAAVNAKPEVKPEIKPEIKPEKTETAAPKPAKTPFGAKASPAPGLKPPIKRPASASVNHAAVAAAEAAGLKAADAKKDDDKESRKSDAEIGETAKSERAIMGKEKNRPEEHSAHMNRRPNNSRSTMNRPDKDYLNPNATPTVAAMAFEKAMHENSEKPAIATQYVPPVIQKEEVRRPSPFKQIKRPTGADVEAAAQVVKEEAEKARPNIALNFIPAAKVQKEEINPFKSNKGPIKRTGEAALNKDAQAEVDETEEKSAEEPKKMSFTAALREHERTTSFRPSGEFGGTDKIDPFKHNVDSEGNSIKPDEPEEI